MYYSSELFVKKGPLGKAWLAGTMFRKLSKHHIATANIVKLCERIEKPAANINLHSTGTLLTGVCRIESKQAQYLLADAIDAKTHLRYTQQKLAIDLPQQLQKARFSQITFNIEDPDYCLENDCYLIDIESGNSSIDLDIPDDFELDLSLQAEVYRQHQHSYQAKAEDITLADVGSPSILLSPWEDDSSKRVITDAALDIDLMEGFDDGAALFPEDINITEAALEKDVLSPEIAETLDKSDGGSPMSIEEENVAVSFEDTLADIVPPKRKRLKLDRKTELSDAQMRKNLTDVQDICVDRPILDTRIYFLPPEEEQIQLPVFDNPLDFHPVILNLLRIDNKDWPGSMTGSPEMPLHTAEEFVEMDQDFMFEGVDHLRRDSESGVSDVEAARARDSLSSRGSRSSFFGRDFEEPLLAKPKSRMSEGQLSLDMDSEVSSSFGDASSLQSGQADQRMTAPLDMSAASPIVNDMEVGYLDETPEYDVSLSQYQLQEEEEQGLANRKHPVKEHISQFTKIFRRLLADNFNMLSRSSTSGIHHIIFKNALLRGIQQQAAEPIRLSKSDAALSFLQTLVLKSLSVIDVHQRVAYGNIEIRKGKNWSNWKE